MKKASSMLLAMALAFTLAGPVAFQETAMAAPPAQAAEEDDEGGFDDWGLLGLLGLLGLAGLRRREPEVRTVDRTGGVR